MRSDVTRVLLLEEQEKKLAGAGKKKSVFVSFVELFIASLDTRDDDDDDLDDVVAVNVSVAAAAYVPVFVREAAKF